MGAATAGSTIRAKAEIAAHTAVQCLALMRDLCPKPTKRRPRSVGRYAGTGAVGRREESTHTQPSSSWALIYLKKRAGERLAERDSFRNPANASAGRVSRLNARCDIRPLIWRVAAGYAALCFALDAWQRRSSSSLVEASSSHSRASWKPSSKLSSNSSGVSP